MQLFLDSARLDEVAAAAEAGLLDGITTNPTLVAREGADMAALAPRMAAHTPGPISVECNEPTLPAMLEEARAVAALHPQVVVKLPLTPAGLACVRSLAPAGVRTNVTLCFTAVQGLLAARAGATFVSPFVGRLEDAGGDGVGLVRDLVRALERYRLPCRVLAASLRHAGHVADVVAAGAHAATLPWKLMSTLHEHPLTDRGLAQFTADWRRGRTGEDPGAAV